MTISVKITDFGQQWDSIRAANNCLDVHTDLPVDEAGDGDPYRGPEPTDVVEHGGPESYAEQVHPP